LGQGVVHQEGQLDEGVHQPQILAGA
ncbi:MAG: hypothetical protein QOJ73_690, partial [Streptosporangiaceae bacterium]|nr:hypothetical protein [Streptosporangiaceae bacterium]